MRLRTRANECLLIVHSYRSVVYTLQERCAHPATTAAASKTRGSDSAGLQSAYLRALPVAIAYILKKRSHIYRKEGTQPAQITIASNTTHKPRARRPTPAAVVFRYTICGRALLRYSNVAARNPRRSVSQPVYTRRSYASTDARIAVRRAMRRSVRTADAPRPRRLFLQVRACDGDVQARNW